jgi:hypothetical protein
MTGRHASLADVLAAVAADLDGVEQAPTDGGVEYARRGRPFALVAGDTLEVRLEAAIATAAARTPDVSASSRGSGWVSFHPGSLDEFALDRARSWFESAWRHADASRLN